MVKISFFADFFSKTPAESTLQEVVHLIKKSPKLKSITEFYRLTGDKRIKTTSPTFGVAVALTTVKAGKILCASHCGRNQGLPAGTEAGKHLRGYPKATRRWTAFLTLSDDRMTQMTVFLLNPYACTQELLKI